MEALLGLVSVVVGVVCYLWWFTLGYRRGYAARMQEDGRLCRHCAWKDAEQVFLDEVATEAARRISARRRPFTADPDWSE